MTCNDCICAEVCYYKSFNDVRTLKKRRNDVEKICKSFVHRDRLTAPTVDAVEVVHGRWHEIDGETEWECHYCCSKCFTRSYELTNYCPNCGAKMDGDGNG